MGGSSTERKEVSGGWGWPLHTEKGSGGGTVQREWGGGGTVQKEWGGGGTEARRQRANNSPCRSVEKLSGFLIYPRPGLGYLQ